MNLTLGLGLILALISSVSTWLVIPHFSSLFTKAQWLVSNYESRDIPGFAGLMLLPGISVSWLFLLVVKGLALPLGITLAWGFALLGFQDDQGGRGEHGGFRNHLRRLSQGELTTGGVKALGGLLLALLVGFQLEQSFLRAVMAALNIALAANFINLLDLRPGRAIKGYLLLTLPVLAVSGITSVVTITTIFPVMGATLALAPWDLKGRLMIGDSGANLLGALAGLQVASSGSPTLSLAALATLAGLNILAEKVSFNQAIYRSPVLSWFDALGRPDRGDRQ